MTHRSRAGVPRDRASRSPARAPRRSSARAGAVVAVMAFLLLNPPAALAAPNQLANGIVAPAAGTTATTFTFQVDYTGAPPTGVSAVAGPVIVPLVLIAGTAEAGTYVGAARLPVGDHALSFEATARGRDPSLPGPTISVAPAPPPTPAPTPPSPPATPAPTPIPTAPPPPPPVSLAPTPPTVQQPPPSAPSATPPPTSPDAVSPAPPSGSPSPAAVASTSASPTSGASGFAGGTVATPTPTPSIAPGGVELDLEGPIRPSTTVLAAMGILSLIALLTVARDRRRKDREVPALAPPPGGGPASGPARTPAPPVRRRAEWESYALDEQPIGTIEYVPPPSRRDPAIDERSEPSEPS